MYSHHCTCGKIFVDSPRIFMSLCKNYYVSKYFYGGTVLSGSGKENIGL